MEVIKRIETRRGANLSLNGIAEKILDKTLSINTYGLRPDDFFGTTSKLCLKEGSNILAGAPVFYSKKTPDIKIVSPISGTIKKILRGPKRKIENIIIESSTNQESIIHEVKGWKKMDINNLKQLLMESGNWSFIHQRPYGIMANPLDTPKSIFVSTAKTDPLGEDYHFVLKEDQKEFQLGIDLLNRLVDQPVFLGLDKSFPGYFESIEGVQHYSFEGPHPAGNLSLHIQKLSPLNMNDHVWTVNPEDVVNIGRFVSSGVFSPQRTIAVSGNAVKNPKYFRTKIGAELAPILNKVGIKFDNVRVINGDVLTGNTAFISGHLGYFNNLVTVIPEGSHYRMFGWLPFKDNKIQVYQILLYLVCLIEKDLK